QNPADRHRDRACRHIFQPRKPAFAELLMPTGVVERDDKIGRRGVEVGWRIVEGEMTVLSDTGEADVDRVASDQGAEPRALGVRGVLAVDVVKGPDRSRQLAVEPLPEIATERRGMG